VTRRSRTAIDGLPARQRRLLQHIQRCGSAYLDRSELGQFWRTPDGACLDAHVILRLLDRGLLTPTGDALLPGDTQTVRPIARDPAPADTAHPKPAPEIP
jgi:hypothetical protein